MSYINPCPFCGNDEETLFGYMQYAYSTVVACLLCQAAGPMVKDKPKAIAAWNRRVPDWEKRYGELVETVALSLAFVTGMGFECFYPGSSIDSKTTEVLYSQSHNLSSFSALKNLAIQLGVLDQIYTEAFYMMAATQHILMEDWNTPEEDEAWADLLRER